MGTGGIAAGAEMVMAEFQKEFDSAGVKNASIKKRCKTHKVGCRGFCARDVLVDVSVGDQTWTYQYIQPEMVKKIVKDHVLGEKPID
jgi:NADH-quinone oxidoreductase subunit F